MRKPKQILRKNAKSSKANGYVSRPPYLWQLVSPSSNPLKQSRISIFRLRAWPHPKWNSARNRFYWRNENYLRLQRRALNLLSYSPRPRKSAVIRLTSYHWQPWVSHFRCIKKEWLYSISCRISNAMFDNLTNIPLLILQVIVFWSNRSSKRRVANGTESRQTY